MLESCKDATQHLEGTPGTVPGVSVSVSSVVQRRRRKGAGFKKSKGDKGAVNPSFLGGPLAWAIEDTEMCQRRKEASWSVMKPKDRYRTLPERAAFRGRADGLYLSCGNTGG